MRETEIERQEAALAMRESEVAQREADAEALSRGQDAERLLQRHTLQNRRDDVEQVRVLVEADEADLKQRRATLEREKDVVEASETAWEKEKTAAFDKAERLQRILTEAKEKRDKSKADLKIAMKQQKKRAASLDVVRKSVVKTKALLADAEDELCTVEGKLALVRVGLSRVCTENAARIAEETKKREASTMAARPKTIQVQAADHTLQAQNTRLQSALRRSEQTVLQLLKALKIVNGGRTGADGEPSSPAMDDAIEVVQTAAKILSAWWQRPAPAC